MQVRLGERIFAKYVLDKGLISRTYKYNFYRKQNDQIT